MLFDDVITHNAFTPSIIKFNLMMTTYNNVHKYTYKLREARKCLESNYLDRKDPKNIG